MMKRIMNEGGLIPYQLTVQVLVNAMIACPSKVRITLVPAFATPQTILNLDLTDTNNILLELLDRWIPSRC
jgi:hypothetical protein